MVLSKRERFGLIAAVAVVAILGLDRWALTPLLAARTKANHDRDALNADVRTAQDLQKLGVEMNSRWNDMVKSGLKPDPTGAESQIMHAVRDWSEEAGVSLTLLKPDRQTEKTRLPEITFQASGTGNLKALARLLWRVQTASIPIKATEVQVTSRKEGTDDLTFQVRLSTVYSPGPPGPTTTASAPASLPGGNK